MEDKTSSDDDSIFNTPLSPKLGGKKLKLNDGSSQDSAQDGGGGPSSKGDGDGADENVDSGVCADKSESTSSDDRAAGPSADPANEVVNIAPSSSNIRAILLNIRNPRRNRNYRKRRTPDRDSNSNDSSRDSDDLSASESAEPAGSNSNSDAETDEFHRFMSTYSEGGSMSSTSESSGSPEPSDDDIAMATDSTDNDDDIWNRSNGDNETEDKSNPPDVLLKERPKHNYLMLREILNREMGLTYPMGKATKSDVIFEQKFYGSLHVVHRLKKLHQLHKHKGCVNSINFHPEGHLLASGSDDTNVVVWDWSRAKPLQTIKSGHKSNVFQSKFLHLNARSQLNIVTCARDGQVRLLQCPPSGGTAVSRKRLASHSRAAHKLHVCASEPHVVISCGEDGLCMQCDVRADHASRLFQVKENGKPVPLYSVCGHPLESRQLLIAGRDKFVRVYDRRMSSKPTALYCPSTFEEQRDNAKKKVRISMMHLTCAVYNYDGSEILGSYNDEDIYLFDAKNDVYDKENPTDKEGYTHRYSGHRNSATFKGVSFFGPKSQYIVSGSDCSYIYIWEKNSEAIVQWMQGDVNGVVNCIEAHPRAPILATSGLDKDVKLWAPTAHKDPGFNGLEKVVRENVSAQLRSPLFNDFLPTLYSAWRGENRLFSDDDSFPHGGNIEFDGNVCTAI